VAFLIDNGTFDDGSDGWTLVGNASVGATAGRAGTGGLILTARWQNPGPWVDGLAQSTVYEMSPGTTYPLSFWFTESKPSYSSINLRLLLYESDSPTTGFGSVVNVDINGTPAWQQYRQTYVPVKQYGYLILSSDSTSAPSPPPPAPFLETNTFVVDDLVFGTRPPDTIKPQITNVSICNRALLNLGIPPIADFEQGGDVATACKTHYEPTLHELLAGYEWTFSSRVKPLTLLGRTSAFDVGSDYRYIYKLPADMQTPIKLADTEKRNRPEGLFKYRIVGEATYGRVLLADIEDAKLVYVARVTNPTVFSTLFAEAFVWKLTLKLGLALKQDVEAVQEAAIRFPEAYAMAVARDAVQRQDGIDPASAYETETQAPGTHALIARLRRRRP